MYKHLIFLLAAPIASFRSCSGWEGSGSERFPLRSTILGLVGAALGVDRNNEIEQEYLNNYSIAVKTFRESKIIEDFHTIQSIPKKIKNADSRRSALESIGNNVYNSITKRDYNCDVVVGGVIWGQGHWSLNEIMEALKEPKYYLYLGRKSCPLSTPLNPIIVDAKDPVEALSKIEVPSYLGETASNIFIQSDPVETIEPVFITNVLAQPISRQDWTFTECPVWHLKC